MTDKLPAEVITERSGGKVSSNQRLVGETGRCQSETDWRFGKLVSLLIVAAFLLGVVANLYRSYAQYQVPSEVFDARHQGFCDFHNGVYFPAQAFAKRVNPYAQEYAQQYPTPRPVPFFSPSVLILHLPFGLMPLRAAEIAYVVYLYGLLMLLAGLVVRFVRLRWRWQAWLLVATFILFSRSGHNTLFTGYFTFELVIGTLVALEYGKRRPGLAALGLLLASGKPTYIIPLGFLMLARGNFRAIFYGALLSIAVAAAGFGWLASNSSVSKVLTGIQQGQQAHLDDPNEFPVNTHVRVDLPAIVFKWIGANPDEIVQLAWMAGMLVPICFVIWKYRKKLDDQGKSASILGLLISVAMIVSFYHHYYDLLVAMTGCLGMIVGFHSWANVSKPLRIALLCLIGFPMLNYTSASIFLDRFFTTEDLAYRVLTSLNALSLAASLIVLIVTIVRLARVESFRMPVEKSV
jgi:hypothetical protein